MPLPLLPRLRPSRGQRPGTRPRGTPGPSTGEAPRNHAVLLQVARQGLQSAANCPCLLQDSDEVHALGHALEAHAAHDKLIEVNFYLLVRVEDVKERARVKGIELLGRKVGLYTIILQVLLEFVPGDGARSVSIGFVEDALHLDQECLVALQFRLDHKVLVQAAELLGALHEDACKHIQHPDHHKDDVESKQVTIHHGDLLQRPDRIKPVRAACDASQQCVHGVKNRAVPYHHALPNHDVVALPLLLLAPEVHDGALHKEDREEVHDDDKQQHRPGQRGQGLHHRANHEPQVPKEAHDPNDS
mmetsp:Transcript_81048/g.229496  ORF Transcript_81048/g.229496 Transcript_81048/m.229496 type:complete len:302 (-) Transcript_81048:1293-2198(-)